MRNPLKIFSVAKCRRGDLLSVLVKFVLFSADNKIFHWQMPSNFLHAKLSISIICNRQVLRCSSMIYHGF